MIMMIDSPVDFDVREPNSSVKDVNRWTIQIVNVFIVVKAYIYIYIYIVIHRQTVSFYQNSSAWLDT